MQSFNFKAIGIVHSPYREKFGIPRQPGLVKAEASLELLPPYNRAEAVRGLEGFSHIWLTFVFHGVQQQGWRPTVRPPRLGGNQRVGVFASRSTHRPNPIGLSVVELVGIEQGEGAVVLRLKGGDLLDGTPVLDIKPYIPYSDAIAEARSGFAPAPPEAGLEVVFRPEAQRDCEVYARKHHDLELLIRGVLAQDPRPAYKGQDDGEREYGVALYDMNVRFRVDGRRVEVLAIESRE
jgi:tRNA-Thr(GGU) m(6)t(6)A37 methyltransferase TsaA